MGIYAEINWNLRKKLWELVVYLNGIVMVD